MSPSLPTPAFLYILNVFLSPTLRKFPFFHNCHATPKGHGLPPSQNSERAQEHTAFQKLIHQGKSEQEALQTLRLPIKPKTRPENYQWLQQLWVENQWSTFADYLKWYNDLDVTPMIQAIENMNQFYKNIRINFIHQAISISGIAMRVCFNSITDPTAEFHLFNPKNKDIYHCWWTQYHFQSIP